MRKTLLILITAASTLLPATSCHDPLPSPDHEAPDERPDNPSGDPDTPQRPGGNDPDTDRPYDFSVEAADPTPRFVSEALALSYETPGVLVKATTGMTSASFYDLNGNARAELSWSGIGLNDSIAHDAAVNVNGRPLEIASLKMMKTTADRLWFMTTLAESDRPVVIVIPR